MENYGYGSTNREAYKVANADKLKSLGLSDPEAVLNSSLFFKSLAPDIEKKYQTVFTEVQSGG